MILWNKSIGEFLCSEIRSRSKKLKPIIVDPGLYLLDKSAMFYGTQKRELPNAFRLFLGKFSISALISSYLKLSGNV